MANVAEEVEDLPEASGEVDTVDSGFKDAENDRIDLKTPNRTKKEEQAVLKTTEHATSETPLGQGKRNAFSELMAPKTKHVKLEQPHSDEKDHQARRPSANPNDPRSGLLPYMANPERFPSSTVLRITEHTVLIRDMFPKSTIHLLLLPRMQYSTKHHLNPRDALSNDTAFLSIMRSETVSAVTLAATELSRLLSPFSRSSQARNVALDPTNPDPPSTLPSARDWAKEIRSGVHAHPSMAHLHIHILSADMHSDRLKHRKHYNSFNTGFFIPLDDFPLSPDDPRWLTSVQNENLRRDFKCWRCGRGFGNRFKALKEHLDEEFEDWKSE